MHLIIETGHQIKMPDKSAVCPLPNFRLQLVIGLCQTIIVAAKLLPAEFFQPFGVVVHTPCFTARRRLDKVCGADQILHIPEKDTLLLAPRHKESVQFHSAQNVDLSRVFLLKAPDFRVIGRKIHGDIRIHVP